MSVRPVAECAPSEALGALNVSQVSAFDRNVLERHLGRVSSNELDEIMRGIDFVLARH